MERRRFRRRRSSAKGDERRVRRRSSFFDRAKAEQDTTKERAVTGGKQGRRVSKVEREEELEKLQILLGLMVKKRGKAKFQAKTLRALIRFLEDAKDAYERKRKCLSLVKVGIVEEIVNVLREHQGSSIVCRSGLFCLAMVLNRRGKVEAEIPDMHVVVYECMRAHREDELIQMSGCKCFAGMAVMSSDVKDFVENNVLDWVVELCMRYNVHADSQRNGELLTSALLALSKASLCLRATGRPRLEEILTNVLGIMTEHGDLVFVQNLGLGILRDFLNALEETDVNLLVAVTQMSLSLMRVFERNGHIQEGALLCLISVAEKNKDVVWGEQSFDAMLVAMEVNKKHEKVQESAIALVSRLVRDGTDADVIVEADAVQKLFRATRLFPENESLYEYSCLALLVITQDCSTESMSKLELLGIQHNLEHYISSFRQNRMIYQASMACLDNVERKVLTPQ